MVLLVIPYHVLFNIYNILLKTCIRLTFGINNKARKIVVRMKIPPAIMEAPMLMYSLRVNVSRARPISKMVEM